MIPLMRVIAPTYDDDLRGSVSMEISSQCATCEHIIEGLTCKAFPKGIPAAIWRGEHDHTTPFDGDHGVRYQLAKGVRDPQTTE